MEENSDSTAADTAGSDAASSAGSPRPSDELDEALGQVATIVRREGMRWLRRGARGVRNRMEQAQSKRDLSLLYTKLGREVERLVEAGEIQHPGLLRGVERIQRHRGGLKEG